MAAKKQPKEMWLLVIEDPHNGGGYTSVCTSEMAALNEAKSFLEEETEAGGYNIDSIVENLPRIKVAVYCAVSVRKFCPEASGVTLVEEE